MLRKDAPPAGGGGLPDATRGPRTLLLQDPVGHLLVAGADHGLPLPPEPEGHRPVRLQPRAAPGRQGPWRAVPTR